jgi:hypothetical protein
MMTVRRPARVEARSLFKRCASSFSSWRSPSCSHAKGSCCSPWCAHVRNYCCCRGVSPSWLGGLPPVALPAGMSISIALASVSWLLICPPIRRYSSPFRRLLRFRCVKTLNRRSVRMGAAHLQPQSSLCLRYRVAGVRSRALMMAFLRRTDQRRHDCCCVSPSFRVGAAALTLGQG